MPLQTKIGTFVPPSGAGSQSYGGFDFKPKLILFFWTWGNTANQISGGVGATSSSSNQWAIAYAATNGLGIMSTISSGSTSQCIRMISDGGGGTVGIAASLSSFNDDGFTLSYSASQSGLEVRYFALGGDDLHQAKVGVFSTGIATGPEQFAGIGFQPTLLLSAHHLSGTLATTQSMALGFGASDGGSDQSWFGLSLNGTGACDVYHYSFVDDRVIHVRDTGTDFGDSQVQSFDGDGFTINTNQAFVVDIESAYIALRGPRIKVGTDTQRTSIGTKTTTGIGFLPKALLFFSPGNVAATSGSSSQSFHPTFGVANEANAFSQTGYDQDDVGTSNNRNSYTTTSALEFIADGSTTVQASADVSEWANDQFTLNWTTADGVARQFGYVALGDSPSTASIRTNRIRSRATSW